MSTSFFRRSWPSTGLLASSTLSIPVSPGASRPPKDLSELRPRYENLFNPIELFPGAEDDRIRSLPTGGWRGGGD